MFDEMVVLVECMDEPSAPQSGPSGTNVAGHCSFELFHVLREEAEAARAALGVEFDKVPPSLNRHEKGSLSSCLLDRVVGWKGPLCASI